MVLPMRLPGVSFCLTCCRETTVGDGLHPGDLCSLLVASSSVDNSPVAARVETRRAGGTGLPWGARTARRKLGRDGEDGHYAPGPS